jgi:hypothetical protein
MTLVDEFIKDKIKREEKKREKTRENHKGTREIREL